MSPIASAIVVVGLLLLARIAWDDIKDRRARLVAARRAGSAQRRGLPLRRGE